MIEYLYIKFGIDSTYFEVDIENVEPFGEERIGKSRVKRKKWGKVQIKNYPYKYASNPTTKNKLYDEISGKAPTDYIFIKHVAENGDTVEGYFGTVDIEYSDEEDDRILEVIPTIYDQYTNVLEFWEEKIDLFGEDNLILNGDFELSESVIPSSWDYSSAEDYVAPGIDNIFNTRVAALRARSTWFEPKTNANCQISQTTSAVGLNRQLDISFSYTFLEYWNPIAIRKNLSVIVKIANPFESRYLNADGSWSASESVIEYGPSKLPLPLAEIKRLDYFRIVSERTPISGFVTITFENLQPTTSEVNNAGGVTINDYPVGDLLDNVYYETDLFLTNVSVAASELSFVDIDVVFSSENLVTKDQNEIRKASGVFNEPYFYCSPLKSEVEEYEATTGKNFLEIYFDPDNFGAPDIGLLNAADTGYAPHDPVDIDYDTLIQDFTDNPNSDFYKAELSELTIYRNLFNRDNIFSRQRLQIKAVARFSREETYTTEKYTEADELAGTIPDGFVVGDFKIPEEDVGWVSAGEDPKKGMLWVRTPFNGSIDEWELGSVDETGGTVLGFDYTAKLTSKKSYPVGSTNISYTTAVDLKSAIKKIYRSTHPSLIKKEVYSTFLWNDLPADENTTKLLTARPKFAANSSVLNYFTLNDNYLNRIALLHSFDIQTIQDPNDNDSKMEISLKEAIEDLQIHIPYLYMFVDESGNLHLEHEDYIDAINDATDITLEARKYRKIKYKKDEMFAVSDFTMINSGYKDFTYNKVTFDKIVSNRRAIDIRESKSAKIITTDIQYCVENEDDIQNSLIMLNYNVEDGTNVIAYGKGKISGRDVPNGLLSLSNTLIDFGIYEGTWEQGYINDEAFAFYHTKYTKEGTKPIEIKGINNNDYFLTDLGIGFAIKEIDYKNETTILNLLYRYNDFYIVVEQNNILEL